MTPTPALRGRPQRWRTQPWRTQLALVIVAVLALLTVLYHPPGTFALLSARTQNPGSKFANAALYAPTLLTASTLGHDVGIGWTAGSPSNGNGYGVAAVANGASSNCSAATFASVGTASPASYTDTGRFTPQGSWMCYKVSTTYGVWSSVNTNPIVAARIGFFADTAALSNGGGLLALAAGDQIAVTFNQPVDTATGPVSTSTVCSTALGPIYVGSATTTGVCGSSEVLSVGTLTGSTVLSNGRWNATYTWTNSNKTLTVVLGTRISGSAITELTTLGLAPAWVFNPTTTNTRLLSATGAAHVCDSNAGGGTCLPAPTGTLA